MYIGQLGPEGIEHLAGEVIANSIDQFLAGKASRVSVSLRGAIVTVSDDGPGFVSAKGRLPRAGHYLTHWHNTPTADGHAPHIHLTSAGVGLVAVNALSSKLTLRSQGAGRLTEIIFRQGEKVETSSIPTEDAKSGTTIIFTPDAEVFGSCRARRSVLRRMLFHAAHLFPGIRIRFGTECFHAPDGLGDLVALFSTGRSPSFNASIKAGSYLVHVSATGWGIKTPQWISWVNGMPTVRHGSHVDGFWGALREAHWVPECAAIHIVMLEPRFATPTKDKLHSDAVGPVVQAALLPLILAAIQNERA